MADRRHELLRPEDATTWEEFQARWVIERGRYRAARRSWRDVARIVFSVSPCLAAIVFWVGVTLADNAGRWILLALAIICTGLFLWDVAGVARKRWRGSHRYRQLGRLAGNGRRGRIAAKSRKPARAARKSGGTIWGWKHPARDFRPIARRAVGRTPVSRADQAADSRDVLISFPLWLRQEITARRHFR